MTFSGDCFQEHDEKPQRTLPCQERQEEAGASEGTSQSQLSAQFVGARCTSGLLARAGTTGVTAAVAAAVTAAASADAAVATAAVVESNTELCKHVNAAGDLSVCTALGDTTECCGMAGHKQQHQTQCMPADDHEVARMPSNPREGDRPAAKTAAPVKSTKNAVVSTLLQSRPGAGLRHRALRSKKTRKAFGHLPSSPLQHQHTSRRLTGALLAQLLARHTSCTPHSGSMVTQAVVHDAARLLQQGPLARATRASRRRRQRQRQRQRKPTCLIVHTQQLPEGLLQGPLTGMSPAGLCPRLGLASDCCDAVCAVPNGSSDHWLQHGMKLEMGRCRALMRAGQVQCLTTGPCCGVLQGCYSQTDPELDTGLESPLLPQGRTLEPMNHPESVTSRAAAAEAHVGGTRHAGVPAATSLLPLGPAGRGSQCCTRLVRSRASAGPPPSDTLQPQQQQQQPPQQPQQDHGVMEGSGGNSTNINHRAPGAADVTTPPVSSGTATHHTDAPPGLMTGPVATGCAAQVCQNVSAAAAETAVGHTSCDQAGGQDSSKSPNESAQDEQQHQQQRQQQQQEEEDASMVVDDNQEQTAQSDHQQAQQPPGTGRASAAQPTGEKSAGASAPTVPFSSRDGATAAAVAAGIAAAELQRRAKQELQSLPVPASACGQGGPEGSAGLTCLAAGSSNRQDVLAAAAATARPADGAAGKPQPIVTGATMSTSPCTAAKAVREALKVSAAASPRVGTRGLSPTSMTAALEAIGPDVAAARLSSPLQSSPMLACSSALVFQGLTPSAVPALKHSAAWAEAEASPDQASAAAACGKDPLPSRALPLNAQPFYLSGSSCMKSPAAAPAVQPMLQLNQVFTQQVKSLFQMPVSAPLVTTTQPSKHTPQQLDGPEAGKQMQQEARAMLLHDRAEQHQLQPVPSAASVQASQQQRQQQQVQNAALRYLPPAFVVAPPANTLYFAGYEAGMLQGLAYIQQQQLLHANLNKAQGRSATGTSGPFAAAASQAPATAAVGFASTTPQLPEGPLLQQQLLSNQRHSTGDDTSAGAAGHRVMRSNARKRAHLGGQRQQDTVPGGSTSSAAAAAVGFLRPRALSTSSLGIAEMLGAASPEQAALQLASMDRAELLQFAERATSTTTASGLSPVLLKRARSTPSAAISPLPGSHGRQPGADLMMTTWSGPPSGRRDEHVPPVAPADAALPASSLACALPIPKLLDAYYSKPMTPLEAAAAARATADAIAAAAAAVAHQTVHGRPAGADDAPPAAVLGGLLAVRRAPPNTVTHGPSTHPLLSLGQAQEPICLQHLPSDKGHSCESSDEPAQQRRRVLHFDAARAMPRPAPGADARDGAAGGQGAGMVVRQPLTGPTAHGTAAAAADGGGDDDDGDDSDLRQSAHGSLYMKWLQDD